MGDVREIPLTRGQVAIVDEADYASLSIFKWRAQWSYCAKKFYVVRTSRGADGKRHSILMHRQILSAQRGIEVDHKDGNGLNNRRTNLRTATRSQNMCNRKAMAGNSSGYKGVWFDKKTGKWRAQINISRIAHRLGYFTSIEDAHIAYVEAAKQLHGEFANW